MAKLHNSIRKPRYTPAQPSFMPCESSLMLMRCVGRNTEAACRMGLAQLVKCISKGGAGDLKNAVKDFHSPLGRRGREKLCERFMDL